MEHAGIEASDAADPAFFREDPVPKSIYSGAVACDLSDAGNDCASSVHAVTLSASTYAFIQCNVLLATLWMKKSPTIGLTIGRKMEIRNRRSCEIVTSTPSGVSEKVQ